MAEAVANAFCTYSRLVEQGKGDLIYSSPLARFAIRQVNSGRQVGNSLNVRDISSRHCQVFKGIRVRRLDHYDRAEGWREVAVEDRKAGPTEVAAARLDFAAWLKTLRPQYRRIAKMLAVGETTGATARRFCLSAARISQLRRELESSWQLFQGELVLAGT